jgi:hypothetical protein
VLTERRVFLKSLALGTGAVLLPGFLTSCRGDASTGPQTPGSGARVTLDFSRGDVAVLQTAWVIEQLHADFYRQIVPYLDAGGYTDDEQFALTDIKYHHVLQREFLRAALGADATFNLTFAHGSFDFGDRAAFLATARAAERRGVALYNGLAQYCTGAGTVLTLGKIASLDGRHGAALAHMVSPSTNSFAPRAYDDVFRPATVMTEAQGWIVQDVRIASAPVAFAPGPNGNG